MATKGSKRGAQGTGTIRKKTVNRNGRTYTYWEGRCTVGFDPATGKQKQRSVTGSTQKEVAQKLRQLTAEIDNGTYQEPQKMTVGEWLDIWAAEYLIDVKPRTVDSYKTTVNTHLKPALGAFKLQALAAPHVQKFYNSLSDKGLSPKTVKNAHGVLHKALQQAVEIGYIRSNPSDAWACFKNS